MIIFPVTSVANREPVFLTQILKAEKVGDGTRTYYRSLRYLRLVSSKPDQDVSYTHDILSHHWHDEPSFSLGAGSHPTRLPHADRLGD